jgi:hypothetical protein
MDLRLLLKKKKRRGGWEKGVRKSIKKFYGYRTKK